MTAGCEVNYPPPMSSFPSAFAALNPAQQAAASCIEGPLLIVAGPGTGKTQTIALRLANILEKTQAQSHHLLALTFTNAGAHALKERLARIIGPAGYGIAASTFHSFAERIASLFPHIFATTRERASMDELGQVELITELLKSGNYPLLRPLNAPELYIRPIGMRISSLKREGVLPDHFATAVKQEEAVVALLPQLNKKTGKKLTATAAAEQKLARQMELARFYRAYEEALHARSLADYDDLILSVVARLTDPADDFLLGYVQENFLYLTVDEFQDTNGAQEAILRAWGSYDDKPNLCVVGDDDQSIYRFQGASLQNILDFRQRYPAAQIITLTQNYRSTQEILDAAAGVIEHNVERLTRVVPEVTKELVSMMVLRGAGAGAGGYEEIPPTPFSKGGITRVASSAALSNHPQAPLLGKEGRGGDLVSTTLLTSPTAEDEATAIVEWIRALLARGIPPQEIAVLYRRRKDGDVLSQYLTRAGIAYCRTDGRDALADSRVQQVLRWLAALDNPQESRELLAILFSDISGIAQSDAYRLGRLAGRNGSLMDLVVDASMRNKRLAEEGLVMEDEAAVQKFAKILLDLQAKKMELGTSDMVSAVVAGSGLSSQLVRLKEYASIEAVQSFIAWITTICTTQNDITLREVIARIRLMRSHGITLPLASRAESTITLTTVHKAKGLEWEAVCIACAIDSAWGGRAKSEKLALPSTLSVGSTGDESLEDERRLWYVAMTRAKHALMLSVAKEYDGRAVEPSRFIAEIPPQLLQKTEVQLDDSVRASLALPMIMPPVHSEQSKLFLESLIKNYRLSPTGLNTYLRDPRAFLFEHLLGLPRSIQSDDRAAAVFGTVIHAALEAWYLEYKATGKIPPTTLAEEALQKSLERQPLLRDTKAHIERDAVPVLQKYLARYAATALIPLAAEYNFGKHEVYFDGIPLTGKVDRIDHMGGDRVRVIDYKTAFPSSRAAIQGETESSSGDQYRQLCFYQLLAEVDPRFVYTTTSVGISYIRPRKGTDEYVEEFFSPSNADMDMLRATIREVWQRIQNLQFDVGEDSEKAWNF